MTHLSSKLDPTDPRRRNMTQSYDVTYFGQSPEQSFMGLNKRLSGTHQAGICIPWQAQATPLDIGVYPTRTMAVQVVQQNELPVGNTATMRLMKEDGTEYRTIVEDLALDTLGVFQLTNPFTEVVSEEFTLRVETTNVAIGQLVALTLLVIPWETAWK